MTNYEKLVFELAELHQLAMNNEFHDTRNNLFGSPKVELVRRLTILTDEVVSGKYDQTDENG